jgi:hypothetical protein
MDALVRRLTRRQRPDDPTPVPNFGAVLIGNQRRCLSERVTVRWAVCYLNAGKLVLPIEKYDAIKRHAHPVLGASAPPWWTPDRHDNSRRPPALALILTSRNTA